MNKIWAFDTELARRINKHRQGFLENLLRELRSVDDFKTALDVGCGVGIFSNCLTRLGLKVTSFDGREENILEAQRRYPEVNFSVWDVQDSRVKELGQFDLVLCFGLLYHLENPFLAIRNLQALTGKCLLIESLVLPHRRPQVALVDESVGENQSLNYIALIPSEAAFVKMLYRAGFPEVYKALKMPEHEEFVETLSFKRRRTFMVASNSSLQSSLLQRVPEPHQRDLWRRSWRNQLDVLEGLCNKLKAKIRAVRKGLLLDHHQ